MFKSICIVNLAIGKTGAGDPSAVFRADVGRGVSIFVTGLARGARLPLRVGFGILFARNGVLVGYGDLHAAFSRADVSFNVFYPAPPWPPRLGRRREGWDRTKGKFKSMTPQRGWIIRCASAHCRNILITDSGH